MPTSHSRPACRAVGCVMLGLAAFAITGTALAQMERWLAGPPDVPEIERRLEALASVAATTDVILLGGSRSFRGLDPAQIDAEAARAGCTFTSFNLGISGLNRLEQARILGSLARMPRLGARWLVLEALPAVAMTEANRGGARERALTTPDQFWPAVREVWDHPALAASQRIERLMGVLRGFASGLSGSGSLARLVFGEPAIDAASFSASRGFQALDDDPSPAIRERHEAFRAEGATFARALDAVTQERSSARMSVAHREAMGALLEDSGSVAAAVAVLLAPDSRTEHRAYAAGLRAAFTDDARVQAIVDLSNPTLRPELYRSDRWFDPVHLNAQGATDASRLLAAELCRAMPKDEPALARLPLP